jgi:hypothetical protein
MKLVLGLTLSFKIFQDILHISHSKLSAERDVYSTSQEEPQMSVNFYGGTKIASEIMKSISRI